MAGNVTRPDVWERTIDEVLVDLDALKNYPETVDGHGESQYQLASLVVKFQDGDYEAVLRGPFAQRLFGAPSEASSGGAAGQGDAETWLGEVRRRLLTLAPRKRLGGSVSEEEKHNQEVGRHYLMSCALLLGLAAFHSFLQANVTGPPLPFRPTSALFPGRATDHDYVTAVRTHCLRSLDVDGVSVYQHIPYIELFCLARTIFSEYFPAASASYGASLDAKWMRVRVDAYHQRLLTGVKLQDVASQLQLRLDADLEALEVEILGEKSMFSTEAKVQFLLERAQIYVMQGTDWKARADVEKVRGVGGFSYALTGALGKRTKFQQKDTSQLVVLARSSGTEAQTDEDKLMTNDGSAKMEDSKEVGGPTALDLNDDTLLESIKFTEVSSDEVGGSALPHELAQLQPDKQPQLKPLDQITLLAEATIRDTFSPLDKLNREEILPYAVRVLMDKPTNWQIYTQALLVRSRIESHRSRTQERSVLQLQAIVDQIIADTEEDHAESSADGLPQIQVTQFLPRAKASESAPITERLRYIYQLSSPTRWEVESELAFAWSSAGSLISALEIFKRLQLWAEVALCYHSVGQEDRARQIIRRQLYYSKQGPEMDRYGVDADEVVKEDWEGEMRSPPPPHAPRFWCILGDIDQDPGCWRRAWDISKNRFARAQRTLGEYYSRQGDLETAREAYMKATVVNRQNNETWSRLGDIDLAVGNWDGAIIAFQQSIMIDDTDAKTYSNLGSALHSKFIELKTLEKSDPTPALSTTLDADDEDATHIPSQSQQTPKDVLRQALAAYKRGASMAHDNWKIWDNVITIAGRMQPPSFPDILMAMRAIIALRAPHIGETAVDADILRALISEVTSRERGPNNAASETDLFLPARGSLARAVIELVERDIVPLITVRAELWALVERLALWRQDYAGALQCSERAWRIATAGERWLEEQAAWKMAAEATDALAAAFESYGPQERRDGEEVEKGWKGKARSAVRSILGKARGSWEGSAEWDMLQERLEELKGL